MFFKRTDNNIGGIYRKFFSDKKKGRGFLFWKSTKQQEEKASIFFNNSYWKKKYFKTFPRLPQVLLKGIGKSKNDHFFNVLLRRESNRDFKGGGINLESISKILYFSGGIRNYPEAERDFDNSVRMYPSAGARYPLEIYFILFNSDDVGPGLYHYNVKQNSIELLMEGNFREEAISMTSSTNKELVEKSDMLMIITAVYPRTVIKYGERGWRYCFLDAGHLGQNIYLVSSRINLKCCSVGGFFDNKIIEFLDINEEYEVPLYLFTIGS